MGLWPGSSRTLFNNSVLWRGHCIYSWRNITRCNENAGTARQWESKTGVWLPDFCLAPLSNKCYHLLTYYSFLSSSFHSEITG